MVVKRVQEKILCSPVSSTRLSLLPAHKEETAFPI